MLKEKQILWGWGENLKTQPRGGSPSISNPIKALDTLSGYCRKRENNKGTGGDKLKLPSAENLINQVQRQSVCLLLSSK